MDVQTLPLVERVDKIIDGILTIRNAKTGDEEENKRLLNYCIEWLNDQIIIKPIYNNPLPTLELLHTYLTREEYVILQQIFKLENIIFDPDSIDYDSLLEPRNPYGIKYSELIKSLKILRKSSPEKIQKRYDLLKEFQSITDHFDFFRNHANCMIKKVVITRKELPGAIITQNYIIKIRENAFLIISWADAGEVDELENLLKRIFDEINNDKISLEIKLRDHLITEIFFFIKDRDILISIDCSGEFSNIYFGDAFFDVSDYRLIVQEVIKKITE